ncbi:MAG: bacteriocin [Bacteroidales bacterium]|nr:bacteriocin [Bacteroidales bacterium]
MKKQNVQLRELSEEELKNVTGGSYQQLINFDELLAGEMKPACPEGQHLIANLDGTLSCSATDLEIEIPNL